VKAAFLRADGLKPERTKARLLSKYPMRMHKVQEKYTEMRNGQENTPSFYRSPAGRSSTTGKPLSGTPC
jgi:hypothetical protein